jgi:inner membrane transporter RhtA
MEKLQVFSLDYAWIMRQFHGKWEAMSELSTMPAIPRFAPPPQLYFVVSAIFHYLGPAFAVLLFARVEPLGVAWLRIASAALIFAAWRRPWRRLRQMNVAARWNIAGWASCSAA